MERTVTNPNAAGLAPPAAPAGRLPPDAYVDHPLFDVFMSAIHQAMHGKGERHGGATLPFKQQQWVALADAHGNGFLTGQAAKKLNEAAARGEYDEAYYREVLGAIVYAGMAVLDAHKRGE